MPYALGIDVGTTFSAAAVAKDGRIEIFTLGDHTASMPSVVVVRTDHEVLVGDAAERRALSEPDRIAREFKRRIGDPTPMIVGGTPYAAESLVGEMLRAILGQVTARQGEPPAAVGLTFPAGWSTYKTDLLASAARAAGIASPVLLTEPHAAAVHHAELDRTPDGSIIVVYDFGGGTFDCTILRETGGTWEQIGVPEGLERLGGIDFDEAVFAHVDRATNGEVRGADTSDPAVRSALTRLRSDCRAAKEALSVDTDTVIPLMLPGLTTEVRLTRGELESMLRPRIDDTIDVVRRVIANAGLSPELVFRVLLVGGSSRIPLVAELVHSQLGVETAADAHPKHAVALGAARMAEWSLIQRGEVAPAPAPAPVPAPQLVAGVPIAAHPIAPAPSPAPGPAVPLTAGGGPASPPGQPPVQPPVPSTAPPAGQPPVWGPGPTYPNPAAPPRSTSVGGVPAWGWLAVAGVALLIVVALVVLATRGGDSPGVATGSSSTTALPGGPGSAPSSSPPASASSSSRVTSTTVRPPTTATSTTVRPTTTTSTRPAGGGVIVTDSGSTFSVEVPAAWIDRLTSPTVLNGTDARQVVASPSITGYANGFTTPGISVYVADIDEADPPAQVLDVLVASYGPGCTASPRSTYDDGKITGLSQRFENCGGTASDLVAVVGAVDGTGFAVLVSSLLTTPADLEAHDAALRSFTIL